MTKQLTRKKPTIKLIGKDGNALAILGVATAALRKAGFTNEEVHTFQAEALDGDYNHLLVVVSQWTNIE
jgi:hypothetical protein